MNILLNLFKIYIPPRVKKKKLEEIFRLTADAFQSKVPELKDCSYGELLDTFAAFTHEEAQRVIQSGETAVELRMRLFRNALAGGETLRTRYRIKTVADAMAMSRILYRLIGIDFLGNSRGEVVIRRCYFSRLYSSQTCEVISALDEGMVAGLSGGGKLSFTQRITEGADCCKARISFEGKAT